MEIIRRFTKPMLGESITSTLTGNTYTTIKNEIGEGHFGVVYSCTDVWNNELVAKVIKPVGGN